MLRKKVHTAADKNVRTCTCRRYSALCIIMIIINLSSEYQNNNNYYNDLSAQLMCGGQLRFKTWFYTAKMHRVVVDVD